MTPTPSHDNWKDTLADLIDAEATECVATHEPTCHANEIIELVESLCKQEYERGFQASEIECAGHDEKVAEMKFAEGRVQGLSERNPNINKLIMEIRPQWIEQGRIIGRDEAIGAALEKVDEIVRDLTAAPTRGLPKSKARRIITDALGELPHA